MALAHASEVEAHLTNTVETWDRKKKRPAADSISDKSKNRKATPSSPGVRRLAPSLCLVIPGVHEQQSRCFLCSLETLFFPIILPNSFEASPRPKKAHAARWRDRAENPLGHLHDERELKRDKDQKSRVNNSVSKIDREGSRIEDQALKIEDLA